MREGEALMDKTAGEKSSRILQAFDPQWRFLLLAD
jgi:hypothetical protein